MNEFIVPDETQALAVEKFVDRYPELYPSEANAAALTRAVERSIEAGGNFTVDALATQYHYLNAAGLLEGAPREELHESGEEAARRRHFEVLAEHVHELNDDQLEKELLKAGVYVTRRGTI